jgi:hypothetical protein
MRWMWSPGTIPPTGSLCPMQSSSWRRQRFGTTSERQKTCLNLVRRRKLPAFGPAEGLSDGGADAVTRARWWIVGVALVDTGDI